MVWSYCNLLVLELTWTEKRQRSEGRSTSVLESAVVSTQPAERERGKAVKQRKEDRKAGKW